MVITQQMTNQSGEISYEVNTPIYKLLGDYFDIVQYIKTYGAKRVATFKTGNSFFLATANAMNDNGETSIHSEIFKYDLDSSTFVVHQKILTKAAHDIKYFCFKLDSVSDSFLAVANHFVEGNVSSRGVLRD